MSLIPYHFVFCPRYRRKVLVRQVEIRFTELVHEICQDNDGIVIAMETMPDPVHVFLNGLPTDSPSAIMAALKGTTSRRLRQEFPHWRPLPSLWTRSFFVSTAGNVSRETIKRYVEAQKKRG